MRKSKDADYKQNKTTQCSYDERQEGIVHCGEETGGKEGQNEDADGIAGWFEDFEGLLGRIYQDEGLRLEFNYKDYSFRICTEGKRFKFTEMSDGFAAVLDIVADLILKMQAGDSPVRAYEKRGIVLVDEVETHLHLGLQKIVMPLLTQVFPNVLFVITTHSPFVLSSMDNAVAFDLEHREVIGDLTDYSYDSLAEGVFRGEDGVGLCSQFNTPGY